MRVLHLTPELPYEPGGGGGRGLEYFACRRLVELGHQVVNISPIMPEELAHAQALRDVGVENVVITRPRSHLREAAGGVATDPRVLAAAVRDPVRALETRIFWLQIRERVQRAVQDWRPDAVVVGHDMASSWVAGLPAGTPAVLRLHNLNWRWYASRAKLTRGVAKVILRQEARRYRGYVLRQLPRYRAAITLSTLEADELRRLTSVPVTVIPAGVDTVALSPSPDPPYPPRVVFTGTLSYGPNVQGIEWFAQRVWPLVRAELPQALLDVVGRDPAPEVTALDRMEGVNVIGPVPEMGPYFARAHAVVVPILEGAGIRVKVVEALAAGRAIVSTSLGSEGLPQLEAGRHLLLADEPRQFAQSVVEVLREKSLRDRLGEAGRRLAEERYDWRRLGDEQAELLERVISDHPVNLS